MKRFLVVTMVASLAFGSMGVTAYGSVFADINKVPWSGAAKFINDAQSLGLMNGYTENGKKYSKPRNNVTLCESVQMIYSIMKVYTKQDVSPEAVTKWLTVMKAYNIPSWAHNATAYALENGIIENSDLPKLKNGTQNATREEVGLMFGKALASVYTVNNSATVPYKDSSKISSSAVPYLALLNSKSLMVGDTENRFNPAAKINRAEMAVLSVKTYNFIKDSNNSKPTIPTAPTAGTISGTVVNSMILANGDIFLSIAPSSGAGVNLFGKKANVKVTYDNETVALKDIGTGDSVTVAYSNSDISSVVINKSVKGIISAKSFVLKGLTSSKITVKDGSKEETYRLADDVSVTIGGSRSSVSKLINEMEDYEYNVTLSLDKSNYVTKIEAMTNKNNPLTGDLTYMSNSKLTIEVGRKSYDYPLTEGDVTVKYDGKNMRFSKLMDDYKKNNYRVTLKLDSKGYVTDITVNFMEDETHGTLEFINSRRLQLKAKGKTYSYGIDSDVDVEIDGKSGKLSTLTDKYEDTPYLIALTLDRDDVVTEIIATTKNSELSEGTLKTITSSKITVTVNNKSYEYDLDDPEIKIDGKKVSLSDFRKDYKDYTYSVSLTFNSKGEVTAITGKNKKATKGTLRTIEPSRNEITIIAAGVRYTYDLDGDVSVKLDGSTSSVSKLDRALTNKSSKETIEVQLTLNSKDKVTKITATYDDDDEDAEEIVKGELRDIDMYEIEVRVGSKNKTYEFASGAIPITLNGSKSSEDDLEDELKDLDNDEIITVSLYLNSKDEVFKVVAKIEDEDDEDEDKPKKGNLYKVNRSDDEIIIKDKSGDKHTWKTKSNVKVSYSIDDDDTYDKDDYDDDLSGLKDFLDDCDDENDDCYVELTISGGKVTKIRASDD